jgi:hypothetical protein
VLTKASFFQGHEWLTWFGNRDLPADDRFTDSEIHLIAEGNRRMDWPKELLVHLNSSLVAYMTALTEFTDRPENQRFHFLLTDRNTSAEAVRDSRTEIARLTREAATLWISNRVRALTLVGQVNHILQDSFSEAHTVREPDHPSIPWCIRKVKAYIPRAEGFEGPEVEFHGGDGSDNIGHTTSLDSIYQPGRDCHEPTTPGDVERCLSTTAQRARLGTRDYLALVRRVVAARLEGTELEARVRAELAEYDRQHLELCP